MERRKLFETRERRKLFSTPEPEEKKRISLFSETSEEEAFQRTFSATEDPFELKLKEYSGRNISADEFNEVFDGDIEKTFAIKEEDGTYTIPSSAFVEARLFSTLTVSITKTLSLESPNESKEELINKLEESGKFPPKAIILLKKAHQIPADGDNERYLHDSGISHDLPLEFGGRPMPKPEFEKIIHTRYEDAPTDIMEVLKNKGIIKIDGDNVEIIK